MRTILRPACPSLDRFALRFSNRRLGWVFGLLIVGCLFAGCGQDAKQALGVALTRLEGQVRVRNDLDHPFAEAKEQEKVPPGGFVRTEDESSVQVNFPDKSLVVLDENTLFEVGNGKAFGTQQNGRAIYQIQKQREKVEVLTSHGVIAVLGTKFLVETDKEKFRLVMESGKIRFTHAISGRAIELSAGQAISFRVDEPLPEKPTKMDPFTREQLFKGGGKVQINR